ncbi:MAG: hypothetical protein ACP5G1_01185 [Nanopusillaceae archaeon]
MKSDINVLTLSIIAGIILLSGLLAYLLSYNYSSQTTTGQESINQYSLTIQNSVDLLSYIFDSKVNLSYSFLLSYWSTSGNDTYCINPRICTNISKDIKEYFDAIYGNRWNLTVYYLPSVTGWIVQMFIVTGNEGSYDVCAFNPPKDNNNIEWYEWNYTYFFTDSYNENVYVPNFGTVTIKGAGWVNATAPFHEWTSSSNWGLQGLYSPANNIEDAIKRGVCLPLSKVLPNQKFTDASVFCPNGEWKLFQDFGPLGACGGSTEPTKNLPKFFDGEGDHCGKIFTFHYYENPPTYKTATDITYLAKMLNLISNTEVVVGSFYRGQVIIPDFCKQVFMDYPWHEVVRLYISYLNKNGQPEYVFLAADPYCKYYKNGNLIDCPTGVYDDITNVGGVTVGKDCPLVYRINVDGLSAQGLYRFNITKWVINDRDPNTPYIYVSAAYWDPHIHSNGVAMARLYCLTEDDKVYELNAFMFQGKGNYVQLGYPVPEGVSVYVFYFYLPVNVPYLGGYLVGVLKVW